MDKAGGRGRGRSDALKQSREELGAPCPHPIFMAGLGGRAGEWCLRLSGCALASPYLRYHT